MKKLIVTARPAELGLDFPGIEVVSPKAYLTEPRFARMGRVRVFNLAGEYRYQSKGYYVSLLAEARGHAAVPDVKRIQDLKAPDIVRLASEDLDELIQRSLHDLKSDQFTLSIYFGANMAARYARLARELHLLFQAPMMRARFARTRKWQLTGLRAIPFREVPEAHRDFLREAAAAYFARKRYPSARDGVTAYDLAILTDPKEKAPPSNRKALQRFTEAAEAAGFSVTFIGKEDAHRIPEFDALFLRETTSVNHHTYRMARRAQSEGVAVLDEPDGIVRCANKVFLAERIAAARLPAPETLIVHADNTQEVVPRLGLPVVLKLPDAAFSLGVKKARTEEELHALLEDMLRQSDLVVAQAFMPTDFDWRIGVLDGEPLFACRYYMARGHWQIYNWNARRADVEGEFDAVPIAQVPPAVLDAALRIVQRIGPGLYGVDLKEVDGKPYLIEVNDNPNIDAGVEDRELGTELYARVIAALLRRVHQRRESHG